jgi:hypothetical protein
VPNYNRVFTLASSKYFKWADYDDILAPHFLDTCVRALERDPDAVVCFPRATLIDAGGSTLSDYDPLPDTSSVEPHIRFGNLILEPHMAVQSMGVMRTDAVRRTMLHGSFPSSDEVFLAEMALHGRFVEVPERLLFVRVHAEQSYRGRLASLRNRVTFMDTSLSGRLVPIRWLYFRACLRGIHRAPVTVFSRWRCYLQMIRWAFRLQNIRSLCKDALLSAANVYLGAREAVQRTVGAVVLRCAGRT